MLLHTVADALTAAAASCRRFRGCPRHGLRVLLLPDALPTSEDSLAGAQQLDFDQKFDAATNSWTLHIAGPPAAARLDVWCSGCHSAAAPDQQQQEGMTGLLSSQPLPSGAGNAALVLHLRGVELPAVAGAAGQDTAGLTASRRRLAQAGGTKCDPVTVAGKEYTFASCTQPEGYSNLQVGSLLNCCSGMSMLRGAPPSLVAARASGSGRACTPLTFSCRQMEGPPHCQ